ncbi:DDE-type integrase/transposase/recombinase, partial [Reinekea sp. G2M2-21]|uniref:DDE-type integrase/transposase/recombinase n=1 Tax=Reinekea sp. G2M2-21 TaxID=2788942 RepID=UPI0018A9AA1E
NNKESFFQFRKTALQSSDQLFNFNINRLDNLVRQSSKEKLKTASETINFIHRIESGEITIKAAAEELKISERTMYRRIESFNKNEQHIASVIPNIPGRGNRTVRLSDEVQIIIKEVINEHYLTHTAILTAEVFRRAKNRCIAENEDPPSKTTIYDRVNALPPVLQAFKRVSAKHAYQIDILINDDKDLDLPFSRPTRFLQYCHIDHTQIDVFTVDGKKPWLTAIRDAYTHKWLGAFLSYNNPSYLSVMMCIRSMVVQFGLLPEYIYVDGGKDLTCTSFETFCALYGIIIASREGQPRKGGIIERGFGLLNTTFFHNLEGNNKAAKNVRQLDGKSQPQSNSIWSLDDLKSLLNTAFTSYNENQAQVGKLTALDLEEMSIRNFGIKPKCQQKMTDEFYYSTLPLVDTHDNKLSAKKSKYVRYNKMDYFSNEFHKISKVSTRYDAKWDPEDYRYIYLFIKGKWEPAKTRKRHISKILSSTTESVLLERTENQRARSENDHKISKDIEETKAKLSGNKKLVQNTPKIKPKEVEALPELIEDSISDDPWNIPIPTSKRR